MCWLLSKPFHTWLQTAPVHAEGHTLIKPTEPHHLQKAEMPFGGSQSGHLFHHGYAFKFCPRKSKNRTDDREPWRSPAHIEKVFVFVLRTQTQISLWFIRTWWKQLWAIYLWTWFVITSSPQAQSPITKHHCGLDQAASFSHEHWSWNPFQDPI